MIILGDCLDLWRCTIKKIQTEEPMKSCYEALLSLTKVVPTIIVWGNHDYNLGRQTPLKVVGRFTRDNIHFCHGWEFDLEQWAGLPFIGLITSDFPYIYQRFFRGAYKVVATESRVAEHSIRLHQKAQTYAELNGYKYVVFGHTHDPIIAKNIVDVGDVIDSCTYVILENGEPTLHRI